MQYPREYLPIIYDAIYEAYGDYEPDLIRHKKQLIFHIEEDNVPGDKRNKLIYRANENISKHKAIPNGVRLIGCKVELRED